MSQNQELSAQVEGQKLLEKRFATTDAHELHFLNNIGRLQKQLPGRIGCTLTFLNNLVAVDENGSIDPNVTYTLKYLKLGHVLHGQEIFVYERVNVEQESPLMIKNYIIGTSLVEREDRFQDFQSGEVTDAKSSKDLKSGEIHAKFDKTSDKAKVRDKNNIYDKLYIQFIIEKEINGKVKEIVYNQSYEQFLKEEFFDIFINDDAYSLEQLEEYLNYMTVQLYFNPRKNKVRSNHELDELEIKLAVTVPTQYVIQTQGLVLKD